MTKRKYRKEGEEGNKVAWFINNSIWSRTFVERHLRRRSRFFSVSSRYRLRFTPPLPFISGDRGSQPRLCLRYFSFGYAFGIVIYIYILSACARLRHPREEIWRGMRTFHNRYRVLNVLVSIRHVNFPFTMTSTKISTGFVLYIYIHRSNSLFSSYLPCQV